MEDNRSLAHRQYAARAAIHYACRAHHHSGGNPRKALILANIAGQYAALALHGGRS